MMVLRCGAGVAFGPAGAEARLRLSAMLHRQGEATLKSWWCRFNCVGQARAAETVNDAAVGD